MSVTAIGSSASRDGSRNARLFAEWEAEQERRAEYARRNPEAAARLEALVAAFSGGKESSEEERQTRALAGFAKDCSMWCASCRSDFKEGDVVYRRRAPGDTGLVGGASWELRAVCDDCVSEWHPSWRQNRRKPEPCAGGCGVLVSHWYSEVFLGYSHASPDEAGDARYRSAIATCSRRCSMLAAAERRRVKHEPRRCTVCEEEFTPRRADARYCSNACRQDAYRKRKVGAA